MRKDSKFKKIRNRLFKVDKDNDVDFLRNLGPAQRVLLLRKTRTDVKNIQKEIREQYG